MEYLYPAGIRSREINRPIGGTIPTEYRIDLFVGEKSADLGTYGEKALSGFVGCLAGFG
jgi:hypothetical protein